MKHTMDPLIGLGAIVAGLALLSDKLSHLNLMAALELWPVFLILAGLAIVLDGGRSHAR